jgi:hypothetical protein
MLTCISIYPAVAPQKDTVKLILDEQHTYVVPRSVAMQAESIKAVSEEFESEKGIQLSSQLDPKNMEFVLQIMWSLYRHHNKHNKALLDAVENEVRLRPDIFKNPYTLLKTMNYLGFKPGIQLLARNIAARKELVKQMGDQLQGLPELRSFIAHYYFLLTGNNLPNVDVGSYGFSIQDYLDYQPQIITKNHFYLIAPGQPKIIGQKQLLYLEKLRLNSLDGLQNVPGVAYVQELRLDNNQLTDLAPNVFAGLANLRSILLSHNQLTQENKHQIEAAVRAMAPNVQIYW